MSINPIDLAAYRRDGGLAGDLNASVARIEALCHEVRETNHRILAVLEDHAARLDVHLAQHGDSK